MDPKQKPIDTSCADIFRAASPLKGGPVRAPYPPGIYPGLLPSEYGAIRAWRPSLVMSGRDSMLALNYRRSHPKEQTPAMRFGSAIHCAVLEPDAFPLRYAVWTGGRRAGNEFSLFVDANEGRDILNTDEYAACLGARDAAHAHPIAGPLLKPAGPDTAEVSVVWENGESGLLCKGRPDLLTEAGMTEVKTTTAHISDTRALTRIASTFGYHIAQAAYQEGIMTVRGDMPPVRIIFVEQAAPHDVRVMRVMPDVLMRGWDIWQRLLNQIAECEASGIWPGCDAGESDLRVWEEESELVRMTLDGEAI